MGRPSGLGTAGAGFQPWPTGDLAAEARMAEVLAEQDERVLTAYVEDEAGLSGGRLRRELAAATRRAAVHPVFFGSAITGAGTQALMDGIVELLPSAVGDAGAPAAGSVFKIERGPGGEKIAYARMFAGTVRARDRLGFGSGAPGGGRPGGVPGGPERTGKVTAIAVFERGPAQQRPAVEAGQIAKLWGLDPVQVGDQLWRVAAAGRARPAKAGEHGTGPAPGQPGRWQRGGRQERRAGHQFARPTLASVVEASQPGDRARLRAALGQLAEQDPLINVRQDDALGEISVSLYGEVQKEVIQATLASDFGVDARFRETTTVYIERPAGTGEAAEVMHGPQNPFPATLGLRVEPAPAGTGIAFRMAVELRSVPLYVFKTTGSFAEAMALNVRHALQEGLSGWEVTDAVVTLTQSGYISPSTTAAHFRKLTPLVLAGALAEAGTVVCEPLVRVSAEVPADTAGAVLAAAARLGGAAQATPLRPGLATVTATLPAARAQDLQRQLPGLTNGEGVAETSPGGYRPVAGTPPVRRRTMPNPLNREEYLVHLTRPAALRPSGH
jgi:ribosomal protection tetracycline resistance protein